MGTPRRTKACWACRNSKVRCDLSNPICSNCVRSGKSCQYGLRLSWPREGDARRSILSRGNYPIAPTGANFEPYFLNVGHTDTTLGFIISSSLPTATYELFHDSVMSPLNTTPKSIPRSLRWIASGGGEFENILLSRYEKVLSAMLTAVDDKRLQALLIGMSFIDNSPSSIAVRQALYALIAFYMYGRGPAMRYKVNAITALRHSLQYSLVAKDGLQHIAAGLLLSLYEIHDISESTYQWELYAGGAKQVGKRIYALDQTCEGDARVILMWLFYHDALSKFTARHWLRKTDNLQKCGEDDQIRKAALLSGDVTEIMDTVGCSAEVLELIARACDLALGSHDPARSSSEHIEALDYVERKLTHAKQKLDQNTESHNSSPSVDYESIAELYRIAGLIYLLRAGRGLSSSTPQVKSVVETGLKIAAGLRTCVRAFPIVVLGCEAHLDEERLIILDLLRRTQICRKFANIDCAQRFIEASWAQDDLRPEEDLDYIKKFDVVMSAGKDLPFFA